MGAADGTTPFVLDTDTSTYTLGGVLAQGTSVGERPIYYYSRRFMPAEQNYSTTRMGRARSRGIHQTVLAVLAGSSLHCPNGPFCTDIITQERERDW